MHSSRRFDFNDMAGYDSVVVPFWMYEVSYGDPND